MQRFSGNNVNEATAKIGTQDTLNLEDTKWLLRAQEDALPPLPYAVLYLGKTKESILSAGMLP